MYVIIKFYYMNTSHVMWLTDSFLVIKWIIKYGWNNFKFDHLSLWPPLLLYRFTITKMVGLKILFHSTTASVNLWTNSSYVSYQFVNFLAKKWKLEFYLPSSNHCNIILSWLYSSQKLQLKKIKFNFNLHCFEHFIILSNYFLWEKKEPDFRGLRIQRILIYWFMCGQNRIPNFGVSVFIHFTILLQFLLKLQEIMWTRFSGSHSNLS